LGSQYISFLLFVVACFFFSWWKREEKLNLKNEADNIQKNKLLSLAEMSGGIAHEINNPLTVILGRANQTLKKIDQPDYTKKEIANNLEKIVFSAERISKIITTLKNFSRSDQSQPMQMVKLERIINESLLLCENRIHNESTSLNIDFIPNAELKCHAYQIIQILINLINNSFDATTHLEEKWIHISFETNEDFIKIIITDSGNGIPKENYNKIFEPFFTTKPINFGTGLGLSISKKIAMSHKGDLIYDQQNKHTCFILKLPTNH
jgi:C4-dicarboxylate-specific signal transduction histidine kinase